MWRKPYWVNGFRMRDVAGGRTEVAHFKRLIEQIIDQTKRRVFEDEKILACEKLFSRISLSFGRYLTALPLVIFPKNCPLNKNYGVYGRTLPRKYSTA